jgi:isocitrate/isopropylmalate dehydrogenase
VLGASADGVRTPDLGGEASTREFTDEVIGRVRATLGREARVGDTR